MWPLQTWFLQNHFHPYRLAYRPDPLTEILQQGLGFVDSLALITKFRLYNLKRCVVWLLPSFIYNATTKTMIVLVKDHRLTRRNSALGLIKYYMTMTGAIYSQITQLIGLTITRLRITL
jgi:hypothetical protein